MSDSNRVSGIISPGRRFGKTEWSIREAVRFVQMSGKPAAVFFVGRPAVLISPLKRQRSRIRVFSAEEAAK